MCSGRVDPSIMMNAFRHGADGVFIGACLLGECHYTDGNYHSQTRVMVTKKVLSFCGIRPERLELRFMSSAEGPKFVKFASEFMEVVKALGPLGMTEGLKPDELALKLEVAANALEGKKLRWVIGKRVEFATQGNLYGEVFTEHELGRMYDEIVMDECTIQEIALRGKSKLVTVEELAAALKQSAHRIVRQLADMHRMGMAEIEKVEGRTPLWRVRAEGRPLSATMLCEEVAGPSAPAGPENDTGPRTGNR